MKKKFFPLMPMIVIALLLQGCMLFAAYGILRTVRDINHVLRTIHTSMTTIQTVIQEGKDLKRAANDGKLIGALAEQIPGLIRSQVEKRVSDKINLLSGDLKTTALNVAKYALEENLQETRRTYNEMADTYNKFTDLMSELSESTSSGG